MAEDPDERPVAATRDEQTAEMTPDWQGRHEAPEPSVYPGWESLIPGVPCWVSPASDGTAAGPLIQASPAASRKPAPARIH